MLLGWWARRRAGCPAARAGDDGRRNGVQGRTADTRQGKQQIAAAGYLTDGGLYCLDCLHRRYGGLVANVGTPEVNWLDDWDNHVVPLAPRTPWNHSTRCAGCGRELSLHHAPSRAS